MLLGEVVSQLLRRQEELEWTNMDPIICGNSTEGNKLLCPQIGRGVRGISASIKEERYY